MVANTPYTCFFIAQMSSDADMERMYRIAEDLLRPLLTPLGYTVITPDEPTGSEDVMRFVLKQLDTADLVVADLTHDNPNVYYELSIRHSLGLPYALISSTGTRFDIARLRYVEYQPDRLDDATMRGRLEKMLHDRHQKVIDKGDSANPITDFYGAPLVEVSPASGLGLGYYRNFIRNTISDITRDDYAIETAVPVTKDQLKAARLEVLIPTRLIGATAASIRTLLLEPGILKAAIVYHKDGHRKFPLYIYPDTSNGVVLADVPTALNAMEVAITGRYSGVRLDKQSAEWRKLEAEEIDRFHDTLTRLIGNESDTILIQQRVSLRSWEIA